MQLYLIRHAESENNARPEPSRVEDPPLTPLGRRQAMHLAQWTGALAIDCLITSPFLRTLETTAAVLADNGGHVHVWHDVFEQGGCFRGHGPAATEGGPGLGRSEIEQRIIASGATCTLDDSILEQGWWFGRRRETNSEAAHRARLVSKRFEATFGGNGQTVLAIIHADLKLLLLAEMLGSAVDPSRIGPPPNTAISKLTYDGSQWSLDWFNSVTHLPPELIGLDAPGRP